MKPRAGPSLPPPTPAPLAAPRHSLGASQSMQKLLPRTVRTACTASAGFWFPSRVCHGGGGRDGAAGQPRGRPRPPSRPAPARAPTPTLSLALRQPCRLARIWACTLCTHSSRSSAVEASKCHVWPVRDTTTNSNDSSASVGDGSVRRHRGGRLVGAQAQTRHCHASARPRRPGPAPLANPS